MNTKSFSERLSPASQAVLDLQEIETGRWLLTRVNVPEGHKQRTWGTTLMEQACDWADASRYILEVTPPDDPAWLSEWFEKFGFEKQRGSQAMIRPAR